MIAAAFARVAARIRRADPYLYAEPVERPTVTTTTYEPPPQAGWPARERQLLGQLADLTAVVGPWEAARLMTWSRP